MARCGMVAVRQYWHGAASHHGGKVSVNHLANEPPAFHAESEFLVIF